MIWEQCSVFKNMLYPYPAKNTAKSGEGSVKTNILFILSKAAQDIGHQGHGGNHQQGALGELGRGDLIKTINKEHRGNNKNCTWSSLESFRRGNKTMSVAAPEASIRTIVRRVSSSRGSIWPYSKPRMNIMNMMRNVFMFKNIKTMRQMIPVDNDEDDYLSDSLASSGNVPQY